MGRQREFVQGIPYCTEMSIKGKSSHILSPSPPLLPLYPLSPSPFPSHLQTFTKISQVYTDRGKVFTTKDGSRYTDLNDPRLGLLLSPDIDIHYNSFTGSILLQVCPLSFV